MGTWATNTHRDWWEEYMHMERTQLAERASGKMRRAIGRVLNGESREELERMAAKDERLARTGLVRLKDREKRTYYYKHIDYLTPEDRWPRIWAERDQIRWLSGRIEAEKIVARWRENNSSAEDLPDARGLPRTPLRPRASVNRLATVDTWQLSE